VGSYGATIRWSLDGGDFAGNRYSRGHAWEFDGGISVPASASPGIVPLPMSVAEAVDPEEAFVAALSSCHMLFFLSIAAAAGFVVERYVDQAEGFLEKGDDGRPAMTRVVLKPAASYAEGKAPDAAELERMHHEAHKRCFIANSVTSKVVTEIVS